MKILESLVIIWAYGSHILSSSDSSDKIINNEEICIMVQELNLASVGLA
jgi:hypothetical protein